MHVKELRWSPKISLWPRRCALSDQWIPICKTAYRGEAVIPDCGPRGEFVLKVSWISTLSFVHQRLKGNIK